MTGVRLRAEYHVIRDRWFGFQLEGSGLWTPTQRFVSKFNDPTSGLPSYWGWGQAADFRVGLAATLNPLPRGSFSPYLIGSVAVRQRWSYVERYFRNPDGSVFRHDDAPTRGDLVFNLGLGIRARLGGRPFQLEFRHGITDDLMLGTRLPF